MSTPSRRRRLRPTRLAAAALLLVPLIEIVVLIAVGNAIGWWTLALLVATTLLGAWLIKREGARAWQSLGQAVREGRMPARELADGVVVVVGGTLLLAPGFVTDALGLLLVLPFTRPVARGLLAAVISRRLIAQTERFAGPVVTDRAQWQQPTQPPGSQRPRSGDEVVEGEIIDEE